MSFDGAGLNGLDYDVCAYDGSRLMFRGPKIDVDKPYVAFLGATETFGKFVAQPFPTVLAKHLPAQSLNLGMINAGEDVYLGDPAIVGLAKNANLRVVQVLSDSINRTISSKYIRAAMIGLSERTKCW